MTSNVGAELIRKGSVIGFTSHADEAKTWQESYDKMKEKLLAELKKTFRPEFLNRIDGTVVFHPLTKEHIRKIVDLMLASVTQQLAEKEIKLEVTDATKDLLGEKGYDEVFGARPLRRVIQNMVEDRLSEAVLRSEFRVSERVFVIEAETTKITPTIVDAIRVMKGVLSVNRSEDLLTIYCSEDLKSQIEETLKDNNGFLVHIKMQSYISKALLDVEKGEIVLKTEGDIVVHSAPVAAL
jgi:hypothetical protein